MMRVSLVLEAVNRVSGPIGQAMRSVERLAAITAGVSRRVGASMMGMRDATRDAAYSFRRLAGAEGMAGAERSAGYLKNQLSGLTSGLSFLKFASVAAAVGLGEEFVRGVFRAGGEMQSMLVTLTKLEGGANKARQAMSWMQQFAVGPGIAMPMPDIMRAYQMAKNVGMDPQRNLPALADFAAATRVPLNRVINDVKDAMLGITTRPLANIGIMTERGRRPGEPNTYHYANAAGQFVTEHSARTPQATLAEIMRIVSLKYSGLAVAQASTVPGGIEQLKKLLWLFEGNVATRKGGVFDWATKQINGFLAYVRQLSISGQLDRIEGSVARFITDAGDKLVGFVKSTNWQAVGKDIRLLAASLAMLAAPLKLIAAIGGGGLTGLFNVMVVGKIVGITRALFGFVPAAIAAIATITGIEIAAAPLELIIGLVGGLAALGWLIYANWGRLHAWWRGIWAAMPGWLKTGVVLAMVVLNPLLLLPGLVMSAWSMLTGFFSRLWAGIKAMVPKLEGLFPLPTWIISHSWNALFAAPAAIPKLAPPRVPLRVPAAGAVDRTTPAHGKLTVEFQNAPPGMRVKELRGTGMDVDVKRGPVMGRPG